MCKNFASMTASLLAAVFSSLLCCVTANAVELTMYSRLIESSSILANIRAWEKKTGNHVTVLSGPALSSDILSLYQQELVRGNLEIDVYHVDVVWAALLSNHFSDLKPYSNGVEKEHLQASIDGNMVAGRLFAIPLYIDVGTMFYRKDLLDKYALPIPKTWQELAVTAKTILDAERAANPSQQKMWGLVFQGRAYEGLTCNALEWINSFGGGALIDQKGNVTVNNPNAALALNEAASWIGTITPKDVLNYSEEEARGVFQSGNAVFMRNWPYAWRLGESKNSPIKGAFGIMPMPKGNIASNKIGDTSGTLGGWGLAVSKYSKKQEAARDLLFYMTSKESQRQLNVVGGYTPSVVELFADPTTRAQNPIANLAIVNNTVLRPTNVTGAKYNRVSKEFYTAVHAVLAGKLSAEEALNKLESSLNQLKGKGWDYPEVGN